MSRKEECERFHHEVTKPLARALRDFLADHPNEANDAIALRVAYVSALVHEKYLDPSSTQLQDYYLATSDVASKLS